MHTYGVDVREVIEAMLVWASVVRLVGENNV